MCLAVPGRVLAIAGNDAKVDFGGVERAVRVDLLPEVKVGQYVLVHAGFAIQGLDLTEAEGMLVQLNEVSAATDETGFREREE